MTRLCKKLNLCKETISNLKNKTGIKTGRSAIIEPGFAPCSQGC
jgi:hypothetical protein